MDLAWRQITARHGEPRCRARRGRAPRRARRRRRLRQARRARARLLLGSRPRVPARFDAASMQETDWPCRVDNQVFFLRYAQRLVHLLTVHSAAGRLYEVDVRLRPTGKGGMLVTSVDAFRDYQFEEAWTWEHQALLHARAVAGDAQLMARFERIRIEVLRDAVRRDDLQAADARDARTHAARAVVGEGGRVRPEAGPRRHRRHRVPRAVLGACAGRASSRPSPGSRTRSASSSRWPRPTWCRRRPSTCWSPPTSSTAR